MAYKPVLMDGDFRTPEQVLRRRDRAVNDRESDLGLAYLCYAYAAPGANPYLIGDQQDPKSRRAADTGRRGAIAAEISRIYHPQLAISTQKLRDRSKAEGMPDGVEWARFVPGDRYDPETARSAKDAAERTEAADEVAVMLKPMQRLTFQEIHRSNFAEQAPEALLDAIIWRVGVLRTQRIETGDGNSVLSVHHVSQAECAFEWGPNGDCWAVYRAHYVSRDEVEDMWPDASGVSYQPAEASDADPGMDMIELVEAAYRAPGKRAWCYQVIQRMGQHSTVVVQREYRRNPFIVFGFNSAPGARLGRSLVELALPAARSLNAMSRINLEVGEFQAQPIFLISQASGVNPANQRLRPGQQVQVNSNSRESPAVARLDVGGNIDIGWTTEERLVFIIQALLFDEELPPDTAQPRTATEIMHRIRKLKNSLGPIFSRMMSQLGQQVLQHFIDALFDEDEVKGMNREGGEATVIELDGKEVKIAFQNPLAQAQRVANVEDVVSACETLNSILPPEMTAASVNLDRIAEYMMEELSLPEWFAKKEQPLAEQATQTLVAGGGAGAGGGPRATADAGSLLGAAAPAA